MKLHFRTFGEGEPLIVLHGVFGSSDNWQTLGKEFAKNFRVYLVDQRNHGKSPHSDIFHYDAMAEDIVGLMESEGIGQSHILGHSMGGKVGMNLAARFPDKVKKLIVVDIAPKDYPPHHAQIFEGFRSVDLPSVQSRKEADNQMAKVISSMGIRQFILKNLDRDGEGRFRWKLNLEAIESKAHEIGDGMKPGSHFSGETLFIRGGNSKYILQEDDQLIHSFFPNAVIETINGAGHWVHAEKPNELKDLVINFLI